MAAARTIERRGRRVRRDSRDAGFLCVLCGLRVPVVASATSGIIRCMTTLALVVALIAAQAAPAPAKVEIVSVTGCLKEAPPNAWSLVSATDPVPSTANAPAAKDVPSAIPAGRNEFRLIGVSEFNLPAHRDHTVLVKGLFIKAVPTSRLNITS